MKTTEQTTAHTATHDAGPWEYSLKNDTIYGPAAAHVCSMIPEAYATGEKLEANARLIAAAPELLAITQRWMTWATGPVVPIAIRMQLQEDTRAAIARATLSSSEAAPRATQP